jgi:alkaline phosphatase D
MRSARLFALCLAALVLVGCVSPSKEGLPPDSPFREPVVLAADLLPQGTAIGDVTATSALLWIRTDGPALVQVEYAPPSVWGAASKTATVARTARRTTAADADHTAAIALTGLAPRTTYRYQVVVGRSGDATQPIEAQPAARGEFTTLPDASTSVPVRFAWSGDLGGQEQCRRGPRGYPIFDVMLRQSPDFFVFLGDTIYSDNACPSPPNDPGADFIAATLPEYRARHRYQRGAESLRRFLETVPVYVVWDDHEVRNNFAGSVDDRMPLGRQALREYWPIASPAADPHRLYRTVRYGKDLELFILDTRQYRSRNADPDGPAKTMLGPAQLQWLLAGLTSSTATWKVIVSSVPLSIPKGGGLTVPGNDGWAGGPDGTGFERERQVIVDTILQQRLKNVVWLGADVHFAEASAYDPNGDGVPDFHEFIAGPLSAATGRLPEQSRTLRPATLIHEAGYLNFGLVDVTAESFHAQIIDGDGRVRFSHRLASR